MRIYYDINARNIVIEGSERFFGSSSLEAVADGNDVFVRYKDAIAKEIQVPFTEILKENGTAAGATVAAVVDYLNTEFNKTFTVSEGISETTATIQAKRPLKTIVGKSLEGIGDVLLDKNDVGLSNVDNTSDANKAISTATQAALNNKASTTHTHLISEVINLQTSLDAKVDETVTINSKSLNTNIVLTTQDIAESTNNRYVTDTQKIVLASTSGTNTGDETITSIQNKRPLKTLNSQSLEGIGNILINGGKPPLTLVKANATTLTETVVARWAIPANSITALSGLLANVRFQSGGTATCILRLRVGAAGTIADTLLAQLTTSAAQVLNSQGSAEFAIEFPTTTSAIGSGFAIMQSSVLGTTTSVGTTATIVPTATVFVSVTIQLSAAQASITKACVATWND